jgi:uncharacterized protein (DUF58 family)
MMVPVVLMAVMCAQTLFSLSKGAILPQSTSRFSTFMAIPKFGNWRNLLRTARPVSTSVVLDRRHVYILPTRQGLLFVLVLMCMLVGSINYSLSLGFVLTFLLAGLGAVAMLHTWHNLANLQISSGRTPHVFAGDEAHFGLLLSDGAGRARYAMGLRYGTRPPIHADIPAGAYTSTTLPVPTGRRGWMSPGRLTVFTEFPLGLFHAWSYVELDNRCLVYPRPALPGLPLPLSASGGKAGQQSSESGDDDFSGLRPYQQGDSMRRVDWKASARDQGLFTKQFKGSASTSLWLEWQSTSGRDTEARLSQLTRWVMDAQASGKRFGLRLPGVEISPATGESHTRKCLEALALFEAAP